MNSKQQAWLESITRRIPRLFQNIEDGQAESGTVLGERVIDGRTVRLSLVAEVVDPGRDPLSNHASVKYPKAHTVTLSDNMAKPPVRNRKRTKRW